MIEQNKNTVERQMASSFAVLLLGPSLKLTARSQKFDGLEDDPFLLWDSAYFQGRKCLSVSGSPGFFASRCGLC